MMKMMVVTLKLAVHLSLKWVNLLLLPQRLQMVNRLNLRTMLRRPSMPSPTSLGRSVSEISTVISSSQRLTSRSEKLSCLRMKTKRRKKNQRKSLKKSNSLPSKSKKKRRRVSIQQTKIQMMFIICGILTLWRSPCENFEQEGAEATWGWGIWAGHERSHGC